MAKTANRVFTLLVGGLTVLAMLSLAFVIWFVAKEALPLFQEVSPAAFFLGSRWMPVDFGNGMSFGIFNFIMGTLAVSLTGMLLALIVGLGAALYLSCAATDTPECQQLTQPDPSGFERGQYQQLAVNQLRPLQQYLPDGFRYAGVISFSGAIFSRRGLNYRYGTADRLVPYRQIKLFNIGFFGSDSVAGRFKKGHYSHKIMRFTDEGHTVAARPFVASFHSCSRCNGRI